MNPYMTGAICVTILFTPCPVKALFVKPTYLPAERLIANTRAYLDEHPKEANAHYTLARIHYLAFVNESEFVGFTGTRKKDDLPRVAPDWLLGLGGRERERRYQHASSLVLKEFGYESKQKVPTAEIKSFQETVRKRAMKLEKSGWKPSALSPETMKTHAEKALGAFRKALELDADNALYHLGLASLIQQHVVITSQHKSARSKAFDAFHADDILDTFLKAHTLSIRPDLKRKHRPEAGLKSLVAYESGNAFVRLLGKADKPTQARYAKDLKTVKANLAKLEKLPQGPITPVIFSLHTVDSIDNLLAPEVLVSFDLDGDDHVETWPWVKPATAFLVWDPEGKGKINSGRQMFGSYTFRIFWRDGYQVLRALDDDRDGELAGRELQGLSAWYDRNQNGQSESGEVIPVSSLGIEAIATESTGREDGHPTCAAGLRLRDGRTLPTWDWITGPVSRLSEGARGRAN